MRQQVDHHLRRARAAARTQGFGGRTSVAEVLDELTRTLDRIFQERGIAVDWDADDDLYFLGERQDLMELIGNAMENGYKWGRTRLTIRAWGLSPQRFGVAIEDDGPGLSAEAQSLAVRRGARLDETAPGSGLGLSIIDELARAYGGALSLGTSRLGGLSVTLELPRSEA